LKRDEKGRGGWKGEGVGMAMKVTLSFPAASVFDCEVLKIHGEIPP